MRKFVVIDTETGGFNAGSDALLSVGLALFVDGAHVESREFYVCDGRPANPEALKINGIDMAVVKRVGVSPKDALAYIRMMTSAWGVAQPMLVAHNAPFDRRFLEQLVKDAGARWFDVFDGRMIDSVAVCAALSLTDGAPVFPDFKLGTCCSVLGVDMSDIEGKAHGARFDAVSAGRVLVAAMMRAQFSAEAAS